MTSRLRRHPSLLDGVTIVAAVLVALFTTGLPRMLALLALAISLVVRMRVFEGVARATAARVAALVGVAALVLVALGFWNAGPRLERLPYEPPKLGHLPADTRMCLEKPEVEDYLHDLHRALMRSLAAPSELPGAQRVVIEFTLLPSGEVLNPLIVSSSDPGVGRAALRALIRSAPFEPLAPEVACLSGAPVRLSLSNALE